MRRIRSKDTKAELALRKALYSAGLRYRVHCAALPGKPDIAFLLRRVVVLVHGCFWHQHVGCTQASKPRTNVDYWLPKLQRNVERDKRNADALADLGYKVITLWECEIEQDLPACVRRVQTVLAQTHL